MMREGAEDYELLWCLAQRAERKADSEAWLTRASNLLGRESSRLAGGVGDPETQSATRVPNPQHQSEVQAVRQQVIEILEEPSTK
jgi:hypothetical protein